MNFVQHLKAGSVAEAANDFASGENNDQLLDDISVSSFVPAAAHRPQMPNDALPLRPRRRH